MNRFASTALNPLIEVSELHTQLHQCLVFDVRHQLTDAQWGRNAYEAGHVPGAHFLHLDTDLSGAKNGSNGRHPLPDADVFAQTLARLGMHEHARVVVYDQNNATMAARLWWMLKHWFGHAQVQVLNGGWDAWVQAGLPVQQGTPAAKTQIYQPQVQASTMVDAHWVLQHLDDRAYQVVDARAPERFQGLTEPMDPVAGHIPHAINRACSLNVQPDGKFKPVEQLRLEWQALLGQRQGAEIVHQCGSGVTGCHNMLAAELAGYGGMRLYPGSWSEWCSDPSRPMVRANKEQPVAGQ